MDRRRFTLLALTAALAAGTAACGRRGPLEPPPYTAQGREWARRSGRNQGPQQQAQTPAQVDAANAEEARGTVDVEGQVERSRTEGEPEVPSDPIQSGPTQTPSIAPTGSRRRPPGIVPPKRAFILDPLLE